MQDAHMVDSVSTNDVPQPFKGVLIKTCDGVSVTLHEGPDKCMWLASNDGKLPL